MDGGVEGVGRNGGVDFGDGRAEGVGEDGGVIVWALFGRDLGVEGIAVLVSVAEGLKVMENVLLEIGFVGFGHAF